MPRKIDDAVVYRATIDALMEYGYAGSTTKLIADRADISEVTLFRKYGSKAELVITAVREQAHYPGADDMPYTGDLVADLKRVLTVYEQSREPYTELFPKLIAEMTYYPELRGIMTESMDSMAHIVQLIQRYQSEGLLREDDPLNTISALMGPVIFNRMLRNVLPEQQFPAMDIETHVRHFLYGHSPD
ncbi:MAG: TetR/AcrR family transcriptional regulator [Aggregatilineales bacterium]